MISFQTLLTIIVDVVYFNILLSFKFTSKLLIVFICVWLVVIF